MFDLLTIVAGISEICEIFERVEDEMLPAFDFDGDRYSTFEVSFAELHEISPNSINRCYIGFGSVLLFPLYIVDVAWH